MSLLGKISRGWGFRSFYEDHIDFIRASLYWVGPSQLVDELVQEAFFKAWNNWDTFNGESTRKTWLYRIAMNVAKDALRKEKFKTNNETDELQSASNESLIDNQQLLRTLLAKLSFEQREIMVLKYYFEYSQQEIAELVGKPEGTIKSQIHYAKKVMERLKKEVVA